MAVAGAHGGSGQRADEKIITKLVTIAGIRGRDGAQVCDEVLLL